MHILYFFNCSDSSSPRLTLKYGEIMKSPKFQFSFANIYEHKYTCIREFENLLLINKPVDPDCILLNISSFVALLSSEYTIFWTFDHISPPFLCTYYPLANEVAKGIWERQRPSFRHSVIPSETFL